ncbi:3-hydroxyacyl-CoA dehydrogenase/enoyl-CoA hydratase family protein [Ferrovum sp.]|uniref:3-hydroxyacyl-CoA dehydrogenase/enoyl-CoA hydratase family protein n=1 Tax=Ferrovum sp. TaxID=2609467 RepID=UPI00262393AA|nr:3-hydroxyacyl-CoA dehydrogenase/enoyl-CoA hydratase family protein [Ferrovum sp.]
MAQIQRVAVLGAGVMGAQLAAHFVNLDIPVLLYDLPPDKGPTNGRVLQAIHGLKKMSPPPLVELERADLIEAANYDEHLDRLSTCDLVIEAIGEQLAWKQALYTRILPHLAPQGWLVSNTSGLSLEELSTALPEDLQTRFCGMHFFNPPRYMGLVELIPTTRTSRDRLTMLESFITTRLGKTVIHALDTPNFVANRIGVAATVFIFHQAQNFGLSCDLVDDLTGPLLGRPRSATYRTADVVGLDILSHVISTTYTQAPDDPFRALFAPFPLLEGLISAGALGAKTGAGFYRKEGKTILRLDPMTRSYVPSGAKAEAGVKACLEVSPSQRLSCLRASTHPQAQFLWAIHRDLFHYCAFHLADMAPSAREVDMALRLGFGWALGPFEQWQVSGWSEVAAWIEEDRQAGKTLIDLPLPDWAMDPQRQVVHTPQGSWSAARSTLSPRPSQPWLKRQHFPLRLLGEGGATAASAGRTVAESEAARLWTLDEEVLILTLHTKMNLLSEVALEALDQALTEAESHYRALVLWSPGPHFSAGGDLKGFIETYTRQGLTGLALAQERFQRVVQRLRYSAVPTVAALQGYALGGGCEVTLHCTRRVAFTETNLGMVEVNVGIFPGAGGLTEVARRAGLRALAAQSPLQVADYLQEDLTRILRCTVSQSAQEARSWGWLDNGDVLVPHREELLHVALTQALALAESGHAPALPRSFPVGGVEGRAQMLAGLVNALQGGQISAHDFEIGRILATVACGGELSAGTLVNVDYLLGLERAHFGPLLATQKSRERIQSFLETGKAVRN